MTSKNLTKVIQRAISDGAFRRQLQSDPDGALRGFDLTAAEVAAVRGCDSAKLTALGIDQRMSKSFALSGTVNAVTRASGGGDLSIGGAVIDAGSTSNATNTIIGDPASDVRPVHDIPPGAAHSDVISTGNADAVRAVHDIPPGATQSDALTADNADAVRAVHDIPPGATQSDAFTADNADAVRAVHDIPPWGSGDAITADNADLSRAVHDVPPWGSGEAYVPTDAATGPGDEFLTADDGYGVAGRLASDDFGTGGDAGDTAIIDPGAVDAGDGGALGNTTPDDGDAHTWG